MKGDFPIDTIPDPFRVGLLLTNQCNINCDHCWFSSSQKTDRKMEFSEAKRYIDQASDISRVKWISFTGGEPFLLPEVLQNLVHYAKSKGFFTECVSNCFWADTEKVAEGTLKELVDAGLDVINISADDFHQRYIPFNNIQNCYKAAKKLDLKIVILCTLTKNSILNIREISKRLNDEDIQIVGSEKQKPNISALAFETGFVPVGRGAKIPKTEWVSKNSGG